MSYFDAHLLALRFVAPVEVDNQDGDANQRHQSNQPDECRQHNLRQNTIPSGIISQAVGWRT
jgi:hypothetical protein